jgi:hypothetical protein
MTESEAPEVCLTAICTPSELTFSIEFFNFPYNFANGWLLVAIFYVGYFLVIDL